MLCLSWLPCLCVLLSPLRVGCVADDVRASITANAALIQKQPVYMRVRTIDRKAYLADSYGEVAAKRLESDPSVLRNQPLFPRKSRSVYVRQPKGAPVLHFLSTAPGDPWRLFLDAPLPRQEKAELKVRRLSQNSTRV